MLAGASGVATRVSDHGMKAAAGIYDDAADESQGYHYVRFLPSYYYAQAPAVLGPEPTLATAAGPVPPFYDLRVPTSRVVLFYTPQ
jgi:hypothetical protein